MDSSMHVQFRSPRPFWFAQRDGCADIPQEGRAHEHILAHNRPAMQQLASASPSRGIEDLKDPTRPKNEGRGKERHDASSASLGKMVLGIIQLATSAGIDAGRLCTKAGLVKTNSGVQSWLSA